MAKSSQPGVLSLLLVCLFAPALAGRQGERLPAPEPRAEKPAIPEKLVRLWPLLSVERSPDGLVEIDALFSLIRRGSGPAESYLYVVPFYFSYADRRGSQSWSLFLPAYYRSQTADESRFWSLPFATGSRAQDESRWTYLPGVLPLYRRTSNAERFSESLGIPYIFDLEARTHETAGRSDLQFFSFFSWKEPGRSGLPIVAWSRDEERRFIKSGLFPLFYYSGFPEKSLVLWPLAYGHSWSPARRRHFFLPLWVRSEQRGDDYEWSALYYLFGGGRDEHRTWLRFEPFFSREKTKSGASTSILRLYGYDWDESAELSRHRLLEPLGLFESTPGGYRSRLFPFYFSGGSDAASYRWVIPFYFAGARGSNSYLAVPPLYAQRLGPESSSRFVAPIFYRARRAEQGATVAFPFYWHTWSRAARTLALFPLYRRQDRYGDVSSRSDSLFWPLAEYRRAGEEWHFHTIPLVWFTRTGVDDFRLVAPLYLYAAGADYAHHWFVPVYARYQRELDDGNRLERSFYAGGAVVQSTLASSDGERFSNYVHLFGPLAGYGRDDKQQRTHSRMLPFWWQDRSPDEEFTLLFPIYFRRWTQSEERFSRLTLLGGNIWVDRETETARERGFLYPLSRLRTAADASRWDILGLFSRSEAPGDTATTRLSPFFYLERAPAGDRPEWPEWLHFYSHRGRTGDTGSRSTRIMPFLYEARRSPQGTRWNALFYLLGAEDSAQSKRRWALPFFDYARTGTEEDPLTERWGVYPFYAYRSTESGNRNTSAFFFPLYLETRTEVPPRREYDILWPLGRHESGEESTKGHVFPLWSYDLEAGGSREWRASLLYHSKRLSPGSETRSFLSRDGYLDLSLVHSTRGDNSRTWALNPLLFGYHRNDARDHSAWSTLLHALSYERQGEGSDLRLLFLGRVKNDERTAMWRLSPLTYSIHQKQAPLPGFLAAQAVHVLTLASDERQNRWALLGFLANGSRKTLNDDYEFRILHRFIRFLRIGDYRERAVEPFFTWEDDPTTGRHYFSLGKFLYIEQRQNESQRMRRRILGIPVF